MGLFDHFPYTNFHELNLDWILRMLKEINDTMEQFVAINSLKYADPIQWDITRQYEKNTIVIDPLTGTAYISTQPVPSGIALGNTDYWTVVFNLSEFIVRSAKNFTNRYEEETTTTATFATVENDWLVWGDILYKVIVPAINIGDQYVVDTNIEHITMEEVIKYLDIAALLTKDIVTPEMYGAVGDGSIDDSQAIKDAIDTGKTVLCGGIYLVTSQIDRSDAHIVGSGKFKIEVPNDFAFILREDSIVSGVTFEGNGIHNYDALQMTKRPHITDCIFTNLKVALTLSDVYTGNITKCSFKDNDICAKFKNLDWGGSVACTSCEFLSTQFVTSNTGITSVNGEACRNVVIKQCVFEYIYQNGIDLYDTQGIIDNCWFEHIDYTGSVAVKGVNCFLTTIMNKFQNTVTTPFDLTQPSWNNVDRGYTSIDQKSIDTRILKLTDKYTQADTGNRIYINGDDQDINVSLGSTALGHLLYTSATKFKVSEISVNTYQNPATIRAHDSGFTYTKLSTGKYYINFNRTIDHCSIFADAAPHDNTPSDLNNIGVSNIIHVSIFGINTGSVANYKQWKQADGVVVLVTDNGGNLIDANFDVLVFEAI